MIPMLSHFLYMCSFNATHYKQIIINKGSEIGIFVMQKYMKKELPKPMGRWNIDECNKKIDQKVDLSNEDHCGPCGQYSIIKMRSVEKHIMKK